MNFGNVANFLSSPRFAEVAMIWVDSHFFKYRFDSDVFAWLMGSLLPKCHAAFIQQESFSFC